MHSVREWIKANTSLLLVFAAIALFFVEGAIWLFLPGKGSVRVWYPVQIALVIVARLAHVGVVYVLLRKFVAFLMENGGIAYSVEPAPPPNLLIALPILVSLVVAFFEGAFWQARTGHFMAFLLVCLFRLVEIVIVAAYIGLEHMYDDND